MDRRLVLRASVLRAVVVWRVAVGADDPRRPAVLRRELLRHHRLPAAGEEAAAARVLPRFPVRVPLNCLMNCNSSSYLP